MRIFTYIFFIIIILLGITFALLNHNPVIIHYYFGEQTLPLSFLLVLSFVFGCLFGLLVGLFMLIKLKLKNYHLHQQLKMSETEINNLRAIPLQDRH